MPIGVSLEDVKHDLEKVRPSPHPKYGTNKLTKPPGQRRPLHPRTAHLATLTAQSAGLGPRLHNRRLPRELDGPR